jgi:rhamnosyltransferase subunit B
MNARILITTFGSFGDVFPYIGLALGLRARGHEPVLAMPEFYRDTVESEGLEFRAVRPNVDPTDRSIIRRIMHERTGSEYLLREVLIPALRDNHADLVAAADGADMIITHPITFAAPLVAQSLRIKWVSTVLAPMSFFSKHDLPVFPPIPWTKKLEGVPGASSMLVALAKNMTRRWIEPVHTLRRELGVPDRGNPIFEGQHSPELVLALFADVLAQPQPDWPRNVRITGAIAYNGANASAPLSPQLETFLQAGPPPIVFTLGSSAVGAAGTFYEESINALKRIGARGVLLVGPHAENRPAGDVPDDVHLEPFAPHAALFPRASAIVHQGGAGTLNQALLSGRPTLIVPHAHDQPDNAYRVEKLGCSRTIRPSHYNGKRAARELELLLSNPIYRARAEQVASTVRDADPVVAACNAIEEMLG